MSYLLAWCAVTVGAVFALSAATKFARPAEFRTGLHGFRIIPARAEAPVAFAVPVLEAGVPVLLLVPLTRPAGFLLAAALLLAFTVGIVGVLRRGLSTRCACFGSDGAAVAPRHVWRNAALVIVCAAGLAAEAGARDRPTAAGLGLAALAALPAVVTVRFLDELADLFAGPTTGTRPTPTARRNG